MTPSETPLLDGARGPGRVPRSWTGRAVLDGSHGPGQGAGSWTGSAVLDGARGPGRVPQSWTGPADHVGFLLPCSLPSGERRRGRRLRRGLRSSFSRFHMGSEGTWTGLPRVYVFSAGEDVDIEALGQGVLPSLLGDQEGLLGLGRTPSWETSPSPRGWSWRGSSRLLGSFVRPTISGRRLTSARRSFSSLELSLSRALHGRCSVALPWSPCSGGGGSWLRQIRRPGPGNSFLHLKVPYTSAFSFPTPAELFRPESSSSFPLQIPPSIAHLTEGCSVGLLWREGISFSTVGATGMESVAMSALHTFSCSGLGSTRRSTSFLVGSFGRSGSIC